MWFRYHFLCVNKRHSKTEPISWRYGEAVPLERSPGTLDTASMPALRAISNSDGVARVELASAKTLIGSDPNKCDLVLRRQPGILDLHALLTLSASASSATIVPFSAGPDGLCFLNGRVVPADGSAVVHGDTLAFADPGSNAYVFELTGSRVNSSTTASRSFRQTLDKLRGDLVTQSRSGSMKKDRTAGESNEKLGKFLLETSTDSLLSEYVERKLRQSRERSIPVTSDNEKRSGSRIPPSVMEPPPSLSSSTVSSLRSSLADSILNRTANPVVGEKEDTMVRESSSMLSTAERNYAEIEKLRLSQRLREVNNVLNGHLDFQSSFLSADRSSSRDASSPLRASVRPMGSITQSRHDHEEQNDEEEEEEEDLPTMIERRSPLRVRNSVQLSPLRSIAKSVATTSDKSKLHPPPEETSMNDDGEDTLDESLPSFSEAIKKDAREHVPVDHAVPVSQTDTQHVNTSLTLAPEPLNTKPKRTQLHQQLIDKAIQRKRREILGEAFIRWRRGLRLQLQHRVEKAKQQRFVEKRLAILRRNQSFQRWERWTERKSQVLLCREEAFHNRIQTRLLRSTWTEWRFSSVENRRRRELLRKILRSHRHFQILSGFRQWKARDQALRSMQAQRAQLTHHEAQLQKKMDGIAVHHHRRRVVSQQISRLFRAWREISRRNNSQRMRLRRVLARFNRKNQVQAWMKWRGVILSDRLLAQARKREQMEVERAVAAAQRQHQETQLSKQDQHELEVKSLHEQIRAQEQAQKQKEERDRQQKEEERRHQSEEAVARNAKRTRAWSQLVEAHLEDCLVQADKRINDVDMKLESLLELMDVDVSAARFQASSFLVNAMLEQKVKNANAHVQAQEELMQGLNMRSAYPNDSIVDSHTNKTDGKEKHQQWQERMPTKNARFLLDMVRQRVTRLHQLHQAIARLAATISTPNMSAASDSARLHHAAFLADVMHERALQHLEGALDIHYKRSLLDLPLTTTETAPLPARRF